MLKKCSISIQTYLFQNSSQEKLHIDEDIVPAPGNSVVSVRMTLFSTSSLRTVGCFYPILTTKSGCGTRSVFDQSTNGFPSPKSFAIPKLNSPVCPTIYP